GDVGQSSWEEVDWLPAASNGGHNLGWNPYEGNHQFAGPAPPGMIRPILEYSHSLGCTVIGGYVYRGAAIPGLAGAYLYADFCGDRRRPRVARGSTTARPARGIMEDASPDHRERQEAPTTMRTPIAVFQLLIRVTGLVLLVLGLLFWSGHALTLIPLHRVIGF